MTRSRRINVEKLNYALYLLIKSLELILIDNTFSTLQDGKQVKNDKIVYFSKELIESS